MFLPFRKKASPQNDEEALASVVRLIDKGKFRLAANVGQRYLGTHQQTRDGTRAALVFQVALATSLTKDDPSQMWRSVASTSGLTSIMKGDALRDQALRMIRQGELVQAEETLDMVEQLHSDDDNRLAVLAMAKARFQLADGNVNGAIALHEDAAFLWNTLGDAADQQWMQNNRFHLIRALSAFKEKGGDRYKYLRRISGTDYHVFMMHEKNGGRKDRIVRAWLMRHFGRPAYRLDSFMERIKS
jgi:hypothetical protein